MSFVWFIVAIVIFLLSAVFVVHQQTVIVIERLGKFNRVAYPGLNLMIPFIETQANKISLRIQQLDVIVETKTHDNVFVKIKVAVQFGVNENKIFEAAYKLYSPSAQIEAYVFDVVRAKVPSIDLDSLFAKKDEIAIDVKNELEETMQSFGYQIVKALVTDIEPNENVKKAMNEINTAQRMRVAANEKAEAEKIIKIKQAEAESEANILHGKGVAGQRAAIIEGLGNTMEIMRSHSPEVGSKDIMSIILTIQYLDTLRDMGANPNMSTLFMSHSPDQAANIQHQFLQSLFAHSNNQENQKINSANQKKTPKPEGLV
ncbi:MAG: SPFH domain-containing protein [Rickettsiaceae bacterium]|nr:SPFH domain-containing protein [Rickettsiaceae bacterium]